MRLKRVGSGGPQYRGIHGAAQGIAEQLRGGQTAGTGLEARDHGGVQFFPRLASSITRNGEELTALGGPRLQNGWAQSLRPGRDDDAVLVQARHN